MATEEQIRNRRSGDPQTPNPPRGWQRICDKYHRKKTNEMAPEVYPSKNRRADGSQTTVIPVNQWQRLFDRFRLCPDTEVEQNVIRVLFTAFVLIYGIAVALHYRTTVPTLFLTILSSYIGFAIAIFVWIYLSPTRSLIRRVCHTLGDRAMVTGVLLLYGGWISPIYIVYLWVDIGNGARYGSLRYLLFSTFCSATGFGCVVFLSDYWRSLEPLSVGLWLGIVALPIFARRFYQRMNDANQRLRELATHDPLTGLPNRPFLYERLRETIAMSERHKRRFLVMFIDLDNFKKINDGKGHEAGDNALREVASAMRQSIRQSDVAARVGGDEFVVLLHDLKNEKIQHLAEHIRESVRLYTKDHLSMSVGIATYPECGNDPETLIRHADNTMYAAKAGGKGRHVVCLNINGGANQ
ncbi:MAG: diguanylate cyclase [Gammaproteobacteria bacterium]|nr:diguanylate cyclase [Gammaproteobacteria bacterium]